MSGPTACAWHAMGPVIRKLGGASESRNCMVYGGTMQPRPAYPVLEVYLCADQLGLYDNQEWLVDR